VPILVFAQGARSEFARGAEIQTGEGSIFRVLLPDDVYQTVTRPDLGDLRVLNADGEAVPHMLRRAPQPAAADADWVAVPGFLMRDAQTGRSSRTQVRIDASGAVLEVRGGAAAAGSAAYLIDVSAINEPLSRLALTWNAAPDVTFLAHVQVDGSSDLNTWRPLVGSAVAQLQRDGLTLVQNEIELPATAGRPRYLRITWPPELSAVTLATVRVRPRSVAPEPQIRWRTLTGGAGERAGEILFDARAMFPVEYLDLEFVDAADAVDVAVLSRSDPGGNWIVRHTGLFYAFRDTGVRSTPAWIPADTDRYWSIRTSAGRSGGREGGSPVERAPRLRIGWHPHELLFVAKGAAPYLLAYGSARVPVADAPMDALLARLTEAGRASQVREASAGTPRDLGGAAALTPARDTKRLVLWFVLGLSVTLLALVALRTFREGGRAAS
jgi:hypothetical protein